MRINNNIMAINTHRQYTVNNSSMAKSAAKLSSGYKINTAGDDAAGLAISEKMRAQIRGLKMASKNSEDAISLVQTAEGALTETQSILQRMRELAVQSASATNEDLVDRVALQAEFAQLIEEIDDIAQDTTFNDMKLLNGTFGQKVDIQAASGIQEYANGIKSIKFDGFASSATDYTATYDLATTTWTLSGGDLGATTYTFVAADPAAQDGPFTISFGANGEIGSITFDFDATHAAFANTTLVFNVTVGSANIQTGANEGQTMGISIGDMDSAALGVSTLSIDTAENAALAISAVNTAINTVSTQRANLGAYQNRLEHKINNLDTSSENLQAAESRIRDIDMAAEMTNYTQNSILVQAATSMLAQANAAPQNVLKLLQ
ncbi:MAG: flagellin [Burkholderiales bacterium]